MRSRATRAKAFTAIDSRSPRVAGTTSTSGTCKSLRSRGRHSLMRTTTASGDAGESGQAGLTVTLRNGSLELRRRTSRTETVATPLRVNPSDSLTPCALPPPLVSWGRDAPDRQYGRIRRLCCASESEGATGFTLAADRADLDFGKCCDDIGQLPATDALRRGRQISNYALHLQGQSVRVGL